MLTDTQLYISIACLFIAIIIDGIIIYRFLFVHTYIIENIWYDLTKGRKLQKRYKKLAHYDLNRWSLEDQVLHGE